jgi:hypothetical protein
MVEVSTKTSAAPTNSRWGPEEVLPGSDRAVVSPSDGRRAKASRPDQTLLESMYQGGMS